MAETHEDHSAMPLALATVAGLALALVARFVVPFDPLLWAGLVLVYMAGGVPAAISALADLWRQHVLAIDMLMVLAALAALSVGAALEGAVLLTLFAVSGALEERAMGRARRAVEALMALRPDTALLRAADGGLVEVPVASLVPGDRVLLRPGMRVPLDATIRIGEGEIDEATITGESLPRRKGTGDAVYEATVNLTSVLEVEVARTQAESTVARMIEMVTRAQAERAPSERFGDWFGQRYTVVVLLGAVAAYAAFLWLGYTKEHAIYHAATLLVAASPCAIVISVPAAMLSALAAAARGGVLFEGWRGAGGAWRSAHFRLRQDRHADHRAGRVAAPGGYRGQRSRSAGAGRRARGTFRTPRGGDDPACGRGARRRAHAGARGQRRYIGRDHGHAGWRAGLGRERAHDGAHAGRTGQPATAAGGACGLGRYGRLGWARVRASGRHRLG